MEQLITCSFCETTQPNAWYCVTCGLALHAIPAPGTVDSPLEGLEPTHFEEGEEAALNTASLPGLELTHYPPVPELPADRLPGLEQTLVEDEAEEVPEPTPVPGLEPTLLALDDDPHYEPGPELAPRACEWCGFPQQGGRLCNACGRSRTRVLLEHESSGPGDSSGSASAPNRVMCPACGARGENEALCQACGSPTIGLLDSD